MGEEQTPGTNPGSEGMRNQPPQGGDGVQISKAELEALQVKASRIDDLDRVAREAELDNAEAYIDTVEAIAYDKIDGKATESPATPEEPKSTPPAPAGLSEAEKAMLENTNRSSSAALITSQYLEFNFEQSKLEEGERTTHSRDDLMKVVSGPEGALALRLAPKFNGNLIAAANHILNVDKGIPAAREAGAATAAALENSKATSELEPAGPNRPSNEPLSPEEQQAQMNKQLADDIVPDDAPYEYDET